MTATTPILPVWRLDDLSVHSRVIGTVLIGLMLMGFVGILAIARMNEISRTVDNLVDDFVTDLHLADSVVSKILLSRSYANRYLQHRSPQTLAQFQKEFSEFETLLDLAAKHITDPDRVRMLSDIRKGVIEYGQQFDLVVQVIEKRATYVETGLHVQGPLADNNLTELIGKIHKKGAIDAMFYIAGARRSILAAGLNVFKFLEEGNERWAEKAKEGYAETGKNLKILSSLPSITNWPEAIESINLIKQAVNTHEEIFSLIRKGYVQEREIIERRLNVIGPQIRITASKMAASIEQAFAAANQETHALTAGTSRLLLITIGIGAFIGLLFGIVVSRSITLPLSLLTDVADNLAAGEINVFEKSENRIKLQKLAGGKDEMAKIGQTFDTLTGYFKDVVDDIVLVSTGLAEGDLSVETQAEYRGDFENIKTSLNLALADLREVIQDIVKVANGIATGDLSIVPAASYRGDFAEVSEAFISASKNLREATSANERQDWLKTGLANLNERLRGEQDIVALVKNAIDEICRHTNATAGLFYLADKRDDGSEYLTVTANFGVAEEDDGGADGGVDCVIGFGVGLAGQAARDRTTLTKAHTSDEMHTVKQSGFAQTVTKHVAILPFLYEDHVRGVVELTAPNEFGDLQIEYLEMAMPILGVAVNTAQSRTRMSEVLEQSTIQATELQSQQVELSKTNAQLQEQTKLLEQRQEEVRAQNAALENIRNDLEIKAAELETTNKYKSEFLSNMSHELRSPLNSLLILAELLKSNEEGRLSEKEVSYANTIHASGNDLLKLIDDVLDISKVEAGKMDITIEEFELRPVIKHLDKRFRPFIGDKDLSFDIEYGADVPDRIRSDKIRLKQIIGNLLSNAFKFCEKGQIKLAIQGVALPAAGGAGDGRQALEISVSDTGIGIPENEQERIFKDFQQVDGTISRGYGGTGLGLSISQNLTGLLGGTLSLKSKPGEGATFTVVLPMDRREGRQCVALSQSRQPADDANPTPFHGPGPEDGPGQPDQPQEVAVQRPEAIVESLHTGVDPLEVVELSANDRTELAGKRILLADDDLRTTFALSALMEAHGLVTQVAKTGKEVLQQLDEEPDIDLVLMDLKMPGMDGFRCTKEIRSQSRFADLPVIALATKTSPRDREDSLAAGMNDYLSKPVNGARLLSLVADLVGNGAGTPDAET